MNDVHEVPVRIPVSDPAQVHTARLAAEQAALWSGLTRSRADEVAVVATELAENLHRHAVGGELLVQPPHTSGSAHLEIIAVDRGPGHERFDRCVVDGYSTAGTMGTGLGAVRRLSDALDAVSEVGIGTVVRAGFAVPGESVPDHFEVAATGFPVGDEIANGDAFATVRRGSSLVVLVADGLGHGPGAADASRAAIELFGELADESPARIVQGISAGLAARRGAAITVASLDLGVARRGGVLLSAGLGNVSLLVADPDGTTKRIVTSYGTAGVRGGDRVTEQRTPFAARGALVVHTDGLTSRWTLEGRRGLLRANPASMAAALWRDHARGSDDSMVLVARARPLDHLADTDTGREQTP